ncbi:MULTISPECIES: GMC oxidoreductase [unclassified Aeromicrobium]|uniref:GMC oxidoreductase n=1 Tax=unclassified Aeromicrobium TaxID=2633570 RepID=UPI0006F66C4E|nr:MULTISPECIES: GMC family oxidoreductase [unclassified Aeromicrobium]KQP27704.1 cholesterol oxidase [Aeromicrobium sp. Leaf272]KQP78563.1 cholesterol oxidase [Aeromicrobium sp. Leaf289]
MAFDHDVIVIGSGFGGSVSALRLTEKGYKVAVLEAGKRFRDEDFAKTSWRLRKFLWMPQLGCYGIQRIDKLKDVLILSGAGVGGGSLVYANTLYEPLDPFYKDPAWGHIADWKAELAPYYDQAKRMLGVATYPFETPADRIIKKVAADMGVEGTFHHTPVGVLFGDEPGAKVADPYFGGAGPDRNACINCGECMTGCRHNAKNTLVKNYLHLAEQNGAEIQALTTVVSVTPLPGGGYAVETRGTNKRFRKHKVITAEQVIFAASSMGTQKLLHRMKDRGVLPKVSDRLGLLTRTNSEALLGSISDGKDIDYSEGVAITSSFHPDEYTHIEPCRYGRGSNAMSLLQTVLTDGSLPTKRWKTWLKEMWNQKRNLFKLYDLRHWSERTIIALVMQTHDNSITTYTKRNLLGRKVLTSRQGHGAPNPAFIEPGHVAVQRMAEHMGGTPGGTIGEPFNVPLTAHFMGGACIGDSPETGVIDPYHRLYGYEGLHVVDGSAISANLGVNPSLTITAQAERAMAYWPNRGETDVRPAVGEGFRSMEPIAPKSPVVPDDAPGALRLPIVGVS